jgi:tRNA-splicing ligase RtcB
MLDTDSRHGRDYIRAMRLAGHYAYAGRDWVCETVVGILGGKIMEEVHNYNNFAWEETHYGGTYWVVRKGATPAFPGQRSFIGSSMGDVSIIVEGVDSDLSRAAFYSTIHGAGRIMSRTKAAGKRRKRVAEQKQPNGKMKKVTQWHPKVARWTSRRCGSGSRRLEHICAAPGLTRHPRFTRSLPGFLPPMAAPSKSSTR